MGKRKKEMVRVMVERGGRLHKTVVKNTSKMFCVKYTVSVRFIYYTIKNNRQQTKKNRYVDYTACSLSQSIK